MRLPLTELRASYRVTQRVVMPFFGGSMFRGIFGRALRRTSCREAEGCPGPCLGRASCSYGTLFEPTLPHPVPHELLLGGGPLQPLVPSFPPHGLNDLEVGERLYLGLTVLGRRSDKELADARCALESVGDLELGGAGEPGRVEFEGLEQRGRRDKDLVVERAAGASEEEQRAQVELRSPLWLAQDKKLVRRLDFPLFFEAISRRITSLSALYGSLDDDEKVLFEELKALAQNVRIVESRVHAEFWERYATTRDQHEPMRGLVGSFVVEGPLRPFEPWLRAAEVVHVGKETSFGMGAVRVRWGGGRPG